VSEQEVALHIVASAYRVAVLIALHDLTTNATRVLVENLVHLDGVVTAEDGDDETTRLIIRLGGDELRLKSENVQILLKHLLHIDLRRLGLQGVY